jgi:hypothetical protein
VWTDQASLATHAATPVLKRFCATFAVSSLAEVNGKQCRTNNGRLYAAQDASHSPSWSKRRKGDRMHLCIKQGSKQGSIDQVVEQANPAGSKSLNF